MKNTVRTSAKTSPLPLHVAAGRAMRRAAKAAREISRRTNTPLVLWRDGKVVRVKA